MDFQDIATAQTQQDERGSSPCFLQVTTEVKKSSLAEFATNGLVKLKHIAQDHGWRRVAACSALTGLPTRILEIYRYEGSGSAETALQELLDDPEYERIEQLCVTRQTELLKAMSYTPSTPPSSATLYDDYLLHVALTVKTGDMTRFSKLMKQVMPTFETQGWNLLAAGQGIQQANRVVNLWRTERADNLKRLMEALTDSIPYTEINDMTVQDQHLMHGILALKDIGRLSPSGEGSSSD